MENVNKWKIISCILVVVIHLQLLFNVINHINHCEYYETCDAMTVKIEKNSFVLFCVNETTGKLTNMKVYDNNCDTLLKTNSSGSFELYKTLNTFFIHESVFKLYNLTTEPNNQCPIYVHSYMIKFCFDDVINLSHVIINGTIYMNPHQIYELFIFLRVFYTAVS